MPHRLFKQHSDCQRKSEDCLNLLPKLLSSHILRTYVTKIFLFSFTGPILIYARWAAAASWHLQSPHQDHQALQVQCSPNCQCLLWLATWNEMCFIPTRSELRGKEKVSLSLMALVFQPHLKEGTTKYHSCYKNTRREREKKSFSLLLSLSNKIMSSISHWCLLNLEMGTIMVTIASLTDQGIVLTDWT